MDRLMEVTLVKQLGEQIGYGNMMSIASALWAIQLEDNYGTDSGAFVPTLKMMVSEDERERHEQELKENKQRVRNLLLAR